VSVQRATFKAVIMAESDYWTVLQPMWDRFDIGPDAAESLREWAEWPVKARTLYAVHVCHCEVCNGGLTQYFDGPGGLLAPEATAGFEAVGMPRIADVLRQAMALFGEPYPRSVAERVTALEVVGEADPFRELDNQFLAALDSEAGGVVAACDHYAAGP
jgi:hypothetical protein